MSDLKLHHDPNQQTASSRPGLRRGHSRVGRIEKPKDARGALMRLVFYLRPYAHPLLMVLALVLLYTLSSLLGPYLMGVAIDQAIATGDKSRLIAIALIMLATYVSTSALQAGSDFIMARVSQGALAKMRSELFENLQRLSLRFFDQNPAGEMMSRLTYDIDAINQAVSQNVTSLIASVLTMVGILVAMILLNVWMALASLAVIPIMFWFTGFIARYTRKGYRRLQAQLGQMNGTIEESISGQRVVKAFRRSQSTLETFNRDNQAVYEAGVYAQSYALLLMPLTNVLGNLFIIVLAGVGGWLAIKGLITIGVIATFISYGRQFIRPVRQMANMYNSVQAALAGAERVFEVLDTQPELQDVPGAPNLQITGGHVQLEGVDFSYEAGVPVIKNLSLEAQPGETVALVGPTGAGKTTITNLLTRFYDIDDGMITIDGQDIRNVQKASLRRKLGLVLQDTFLFSDTIMENIRYGRLDASDEEVVASARLADADHFIRQLPEGYQTKLSERGSNLSQGQRQLLTIARAVLADPEILILDEATSSVDTRTEARLQGALLRLMRGRTSFVIAHRLSTIRDADQVLVIDQGELVEKGTHQELLDRRGFYYNLYLSQFKGQSI